MSDDVKKTPARLLAEHLYRRLSPDKTEEANIAEIERAFQDQHDQWQARFDQVYKDSDELIEDVMKEERRKHLATLEELNELKRKYRELRARRGLDQPPEKSVE